MKRSFFLRVFSSSVFVFFSTMCIRSPSYAACPICVVAIGAVAGFFGESLPPGLEISWYGAFFAMCGLWLSRKMANMGYFKGRGFLWALLASSLAAPFSVFMFGGDVFSSVVWAVSGGLVIMSSIVLSKYTTFKRGRRLLPFQSTVFATVAMVVFSAAVFLF